MTLLQYWQEDNNKSSLQTRKLVCITSKLQAKNHAVSHFRKPQS